MYSTAGKVVLSLNRPVYAGEIFFRFLPRLEKNREIGAGVFPFAQAAEECRAQGAESPTKRLANVQVFASHSTDYQRLLFFFFFQGNQNRFACPTSIWPVTCANFTPRLGRTAPLNAPAAG